LVFDFDSPRLDHNPTWLDHNPTWIARSIQRTKTKDQKPAPWILDLAIHFTPSSDIFCNAISVRFVFEVWERPSAKLSSAELAT